MQHFTIRDIENLTGIKAHTLRIWEHRYRIFTPKRKESQHRIYDNDDLKQLLHIAFLYHHGWKISKIAALSPEEISHIIRDTRVGKENYTLFVNQLIEAALDFDEYRFLSVLNTIVDEIGFEKCIIDVCYPYLVRIGHLWSTNNAIPAQEHFSSYIVQNRIIVETEKHAPAPDARPDIVLLCPKGEFHELPLLFLNYLLRKYGWTTIYMGTNISLDEVEQIVRVNDVPNIYLHLITNFTGFEIDDYLQDFCKRFLDRRVFASGGGIHAAQRSFVNLTILKNDQQIYDLVKRKDLI